MRESTGPKALNRGGPCRPGELPCCRLRSWRLRSCRLRSWAGPHNDGPYTHNKRWTTAQTLVLLDWVLGKFGVSCHLNAAQLPATCKSRATCGHSTVAEDNHNFAGYQDDISCPYLLIIEAVRWLEFWFRERPQAAPFTLTTRTLAKMRLTLLLCATVALTCWRSASGADFRRGLAGTTPQCMWDGTSCTLDSKYITTIPGSPTSDSAK